MGRFEKFLPRHASRRDGILVFLARKRLNEQKITLSLEILCQTNRRICVNEILATGEPVFSITRFSWKA